MGKEVAAAFRAVARSVKLAQVVSALSRSAARLRLLAILVLALALFAPSLRNTFALDDRLVAKATRDGGAPNVMVAELQPLGRYFTTNYWQGIDDKDLLYRPVTILSYAVLYAVVGRHLGGEVGEALPQHVANVLLHLGAIWLTYLLLRAVRVRRGPGLLAASVFAMHAIHSEVVAGVVGRAELLAFDFGALATLAFVQACRVPTRRTGWLLAAAAALFVAFGSKESAVAWAPFLLLVQVVRTLRAEPRTSAGALLRAFLPPWLWASAPPLAAFLALRAATLHRIGADAGAWAAALESSTAGWRLGNGLVQWVYGLGSCVVPWHLSADHGPAVFTPTSSWAQASVLGAAGLLVATLVAGLLAWRRHPWLFLATATFFGHSFLTSNVPFRIGTDYAERLYYAPSLALALVVGWLATRLPGRWRTLATAVLALWLSWNGWLIVQRNGVWRDDPTLYTAEVENQPRSARMQLQYADLLRQRGDKDAMARHLERVVELFPEHAQAWNVLGAYHFDAGRVEQALSCLRRSLRAGYFDPGKRVEAAVNLALALAATGKAAEAVEPLEQAFRTEPRALAARVPDLRRHLTAGVDYAWFDGLLARLAAAAPAAQAWPYQRAWLACDRKQHEAAIAYSRQALAVARSQPFVAEMQVVQAAALAAIGRGPEAKVLAQQVLDDASSPPAMRATAQQMVQRIK